MPVIEHGSIVFGQIWSVGQLEDYITTYPPNGIDLAYLRTVLRAEDRGPEGYRGQLEDLALRLFLTGHQLSVVAALQSLGHLPPPVHRITVEVNLLGFVLNKCT